MNPVLLSRDDVLDLFRACGFVRIFENAEPWHGYNLRDPYFKTVDVGTIYASWRGYVERLDHRLVEQRDGKQFPRYVEDNADCENHSGWFLAYLQQEEASLAVSQDLSARISGYGGFTYDFVSCENGNHQGLVFIHHNKSLHFFEVLKGRYEVRSRAEIESAWNVAGG